MFCDNYGEDVRTAARAGVGYEIVFCGYKVVFNGVGAVHKQQT